MQRGFSLLLFLPLHCPAPRPPHLVPAITTATVLAAGSLGNPPWDGGEQDAYQKGEGFLESSFHCQGDEEEVGVSKSNPEDRVSHPCKSLIALLPTREAKEELYYP